MGVRFCAHAAITLRAVGLDPVNAILLTALSASASPVVPAPVIGCSTGFSGTTSANELTSQPPTAGAYSLGLNTTALPAARAAAREPSAGHTGKFHGPITPTTPSGAYST